MCNRIPKGPYRLDWKHWAFFFNKAQLQPQWVINAYGGKNCHKSIPNISQLFGRYIFFTFKQTDLANFWRPRENLGYF